MVSFFFFFRVSGKIFLFDLKINSQHAESRYEAWKRNKMNSFHILSHFYSNQIILCPSYFDSYHKQETFVKDGLKIDKIHTKDGHKKDKRQTHDGQNGHNMDKNGLETDKCWTKWTQYGQKMDKRQTNARQKMSKWTTT